MGGLYEERIGGIGTAVEYESKIKGEWRRLGDSSEICPVMDGSISFEIKLKVCVH